MPELIKISPNDTPLIRRASFTVANAFADDPGTIYLIPDEKRRANLHFAFEYFLRSSLAGGSEVYATSVECEGIAIWSNSQLSSQLRLILSRDLFLQLRCGWRFIMVR